MSGVTTPAPAAPLLLVGEKRHREASHKLASSVVSAAVVKTAVVKVGGNVAAERKRNKQDEVVKAIGDVPVTERYILHKVGDNRYTREILRRLMAISVVERMGKGGSNDPYLYKVVRSISECIESGVVDPALDLRMRRIEGRILTFLLPIETPVTEKTIRATVGDNTGTGKALRRLIADTRVARLGRGGAGDPFMYQTSPHAAAAASSYAPAAAPSTPAPRCCVSEPVAVEEARSKRRRGSCGGGCAEEDRQNPEERGEEEGDAGASREPEPECEEDGEDGEEEEEEEEGGVRSSMPTRGPSVEGEFPAGDRQDPDGDRQTPVGAVDVRKRSAHKAGLDAALDASAAAHRALDIARLVSSLSSPTLLSSGFCLSVRREQAGEGVEQEEGGAGDRMEVEEEAGGEGARCGEGGEFSELAQCRFSQEVQQAVQQEVQEGGCEDEVSLLLDFSAADSQLSEELEEEGEGYPPSSPESSSRGAASPSPSSHSAGNADADAGSIATSDEEGSSDSECSSASDEDVADSFLA